MQFETQLVRGIFHRRYKRFFAEVTIEGTKQIAHVPNTGSLKSCLTEGTDCLVSRSNDPKRKLALTLHLIKANGIWVGVNTQWPNTLVKEAIEAKDVDHWREFPYYRREAFVSEETRLDFVLSHFELNDFDIAKIAKRDRSHYHFIEVKSVTLRDQDLALFPDAKSERGQRHLKKLIELSRLGFSTEIVFTVQRTDVKAFAPAKDIDPEYSRLFFEAQKKGVRVTPFLCTLNESSVCLNSTSVLPVRN